MGEVLLQHGAAAGLRTLLQWWVYRVVAFQFESQLCHRSKTRRGSQFSFLFLSVFLEDFTEDLLSLHDAEVQRLQQHHEEHRELFDGVQQWEESWRLFLELEVS